MQRIFENQGRKNGSVAQLDRATALLWVVGSIRRSRNKQIWI